MSLFPLFQNTSVSIALAASPYPTHGLLGMWGVRCMRRRRRVRLQWIAPACPSEEARGRIISFLLMSSTFGEGGESITPLLSFFFSWLQPLRPYFKRDIHTVYRIRDAQHNTTQHTTSCIFKCNQSFLSPLLSLLLSLRISSSFFLLLLLLLFSPFMGFCPHTLI